MIFFFSIMLALLILAGLGFLLGFRLGGDHWHNAVTRVRLGSVQAEPRLHDRANRDPRSELSVATCSRTRCLGELAPGDQLGRLRRSVVYPVQMWRFGSVRH